MGPLLDNLHICDPPLGNRPHIGEIAGPALHNRPSDRVTGNEGDLPR
jgi:hypothetical protein